MLPHLLLGAHSEPACILAQLMPVPCPSLCALCSGETVPLGIGEGGGGGGGVVIHWVIFLGTSSIRTA